jgi:anthranilate/para-aminobenzoate synthase component II
LGNSVDNGKNIKGNYTLTKYTDHTLFKNIDMDTTQFSFDFNDKLDVCPEGFKVIGELDGIISAIVNDDKKIWATLFHPEDIEDTYTILDNFLDICNYSPESKIDYLKGGNKVNNIIEKYNDFIKRLN